MANSHAFEIFTCILSSRIWQFNPLWFGGDIGMSHLLLLFAASKSSCFQAELSPLEPSKVVVISP